MKNLVTEYVSDLMSGVERRQAERSLQPPDKPELTEATRRAAERGFDAGDALALDWLSDHQSDDEVRAFTAAASRYWGAKRLCHIGGSKDKLDAAYESLRAAFVDACAEEYE